MFLNIVFLELCKWYDLNRCSCGIKNQTRRCSGDCFDVDSLVNKTEHCKEEVCQGT